MKQNILMNLRTESYLSITHGDSFFKNELNALKPECRAFQQSIQENKLRTLLLN